MGNKTNVKQYQINALKQKIKVFEKQLDVEKDKIEKIIEVVKFYAGEKIEKLVRESLKQYKR